MAFNLQVLKDWNDINNTITTKCVVKNRLSFIKGLNVIPDVKGSIEVPFLYSNPSFTNILCNTTTSGSTSLGTTTVSTCFVSYHEELCAAELNGKTFSSEQTSLDDLVFESEMANEAAAQVEKFCAKQFLQGHPTVPVDGVACTGLYFLLDQSSASTINLTYTAVTAANGVSVMDTYLASVPDAVRDLPYVSILLKSSDFQGLKNAYRNANLVQYNEQDSNADVFKIPGYDNMYAVKMSDALSRVVITFGENLIYPNNINSGIELYKDMSKRKYVKHADFRIGAGFHFADMIVYAK